MAQIHEESTRGGIHSDARARQTAAGAIMRSWPRADDFYDKGNCTTVYSTVVLEGGAGRSRSPCARGRGRLATLQPTLKGGMDESPAQTWRAWLLGRLLPAWAQSHAAEEAQQCCAVCLEPISEPSQSGSQCCQHRFHAQCLQQWQAQGVASDNGCPTCRRGGAGTLPSTLPSAARDLSEEPGSSGRAAWLWSWLTLAMVPWPTSQSTTPEWDPAHGIGDWEARLAALHAADDAEAESSEEDDEDSVSDDAEDFEEQFAEGAAGGCQWCKVKDAEHDCPHCGEGGFGLMAECSCPDGFHCGGQEEGDDD